MKNTTTLLAGLGLLAGGAYAADKAAQTTAAPAREFTLVAVLEGKAKFWLPSTIIVKKGEKVKLTLKNMIEGNEKDPATQVHGFAIDEFKVVEVVNNGKDAVVEFTADKAGLFRMYCQLHPAHIGGQLLVLE